MLIVEGKGLIREVDEEHDGGDSASAGSPVSRPPAIRPFPDRQSTCAVSSWKVPLPLEVSASYQMPVRRVEPAGSEPR